jgi:hypothetical protein
LPAPTTILESRKDKNPSLRQDGLSQSSTPGRWRKPQIFAIARRTAAVTRFWALERNDTMDEAGPATIETFEFKLPAPSLSVFDKDPFYEVKTLESPTRVVRWRLIDLAQWVFEEFRVTISKQTLSRELRAMGFRKLSARPRHQAQDREADWMRIRTRRLQPPRSNSGESPPPQSQFFFFALRNRPLACRT